MAKRSRAEVEKRRRQVARYLVRGTATHVVADALRVTERTVQRDIRAVRAELKESLGSREALDYFADFILELKEINRELWRRYHQIEDDATQVGTASNVLGVIARNEREMIDAGQRLGLVFESPQKLEIVEQMQREFLDAIEREDPKIAERILRRYREKLLTP